MKAQTKVDEFAFILLGSIVFIAILAVAWISTPSSVSYVSPKSLVFTLSPGESETKYITINGSGYMEIKKEGDVADWLEPQYNSFTVSGGGKLWIRVSVPYSTPYGAYTGKLLIVSNQSTQTVDVVVKVLNVTKFSVRTIPIPDFSISYAGSKKTLLQSRDIELKNSKKTFVFSLSKNEITQLASLTLRLVIDDTNNYGNFVVYLNSIPIYSAKPHEGEIDIPLNLSLIEENNVLTIETEGSGWSFWRKSYCHIYSLNLYAEYNSISKTITFSMSDNEISNFVALEFISMLETSTPEPTLKIKLNNQLVYWNKPPLSSIDIRIDRDLLGNRLVLNRTNKLTFYLTEKGSMSFSNVLLKVLTKD